MQISKDTDVLITPKDVHVIMPTCMYSDAVNSTRRLAVTSPCFCNGYNCGQKGDHRFDSYSGLRIRVINPRIYELKNVRCVYSGMTMISN